MTLLVVRVSEIVEVVIEPVALDVARSAPIANVVLTTGIVPTGPPSVPKNSP